MNDILSKEDGFVLIWMMIIMGVLLLLIAHHLEIARVIFYREQMITATDAGSLAGAMTADPIAQNCQYEMKDENGEPVLVVQVDDWDVQIDKTTADTQALQVAHLNTNFHFGDTHWESNVSGDKYSFKIKNIPVESTILRRLWNINIFVHADSEAQVTKL